MSASGRPDVLFVLADSPWPATSGGQIRNSELHRALSTAARVRSLIFRLRDEVDRTALPPDTEVVDMPLPASRSGRIALRARGLPARRHPFLQHLVEEHAPAVLAARLSAQPAAVVVLTYPCYAPFIDVAAAAGARVIVDVGEARGPIARQRLGDSRNAGRWLRALGDLLVARSMEKRIAGADLFWAASSAESPWLPGSVAGRLRVVPNTLDLDRYSFRLAPSVLAPRVGFVGSLDYPPNGMAARRLVDRILPLLIAARPEARVIVIGRRPGRDLVERSRSAAAWELRADVADPMAELAEAGLLVAPLTAGGGTKYKILEAAASGIPVVATPTALQGLALEADRDLLVGERDEDLAAAILRLWSEDGLATRLSENAARRVRDLYGPRALDAAVAGALDEVLATPSGGRP